MKSNINQEIAWNDLKIGQGVNLKDIKKDGRHIRLEVYGVSKEVTNDYHLFYSFLKELPAKVKMGALTPPIIVKGIPENPGLTGVLVIDYSHITFHAFTNKNRINFDLYSCKDFDSEVVIKHAEKFFGVSRNNMIIKEDLRF
ncbi:S-adenosylmethionine decarboxylase [Candidatus Woesearchaeota archaeon]|nr:S-adenosylmethionine decarboxylase [Candidatus Woesearchaeota archaeon]